MAVIVDNDDSFLLKNHFADVFACDFTIKNYIKNLLTVLNNFKLIKNSLLN